MGQYTSYWLYQKYEKRGEQDWLPTYPNVYSTNGDGSMSTIVKIDDDPACGYVPTGQTQYRWVNIPISQDYICGECEVSPVEPIYKWERSNDTICVWSGGDTYRWVESGWTCVGYDKYNRVVQQVSHDGGQTWEDTSTTSATTLIERNSTDCGYQPIEPIYRWVDLDPSVDYYCSGYTKYYKQQRQISYDNGVTWQNLNEYQKGESTGLVTQDCGFNPPVITPGNYTTQPYTIVSRNGGYYSFFTPGYTTGNLYYSTDNGQSWMDYEITTSAGTDDRITVPAGGKIMLIGDFRKSSSVSTQSPLFYVSHSGQSDLEGNIMSLYYLSDFSSKTSFPSDIGNSWVYPQFTPRRSIINASNLVLPATTLTNNCYEQMFAGESGLTASPQLPATSLADRCYTSMFSGCTSLTTAPQLPAATATYWCYNGMFEGCTSLTQAPELPATTLAEGCYNDMFSGCTSLTTAQSTLPATTLANSCYDSMFEGCTSLTTAPELPATRLVSFCYRNMFAGCTRLNYVKCLATNVSASYCTYEWLTYVSSSGTFVKPTSMTKWSWGTSGIPGSWTVQNI